MWSKHMTCLILKNGKVLFFFLPFNWKLFESQAVQECKDEIVISLTHFVKRFLTLHV